jgi:prepilin-type N-terminal cleavage/methylation domain-containing protein
MATTDERTTSMRKMIRALSREAGFTLVEMLVTVTILGVLAAVVTVGVGGASSNAQIRANQATFGDFQSAVDSWLASNPTFTTADIPVTATDQAGVSALWYQSDGAVAASAANLSSVSCCGAGAYGAIDTASGVGSPAFSSFFRVNAGATVVCVLHKAAIGALKADDSQVKACHN